jgi:Flp pilus assembly protein TadG
MRHTCPHRQRGAVIITVALMLLFLLGFMGIALDFGRLFVVKTELQTAMDSCALSAAQELDAQADAITRATSAGLTASNQNRVNLQSPTWSGQGQLTAAEIRFRDPSYVVTSNPVVAKYAQCQHAQPNIPMWLMHMLGTFSGNTGVFPAARSVVANAVATRGSAQTTCPVPLMLKPKPGGVAPDYGFTTGEWITVLMAQNAAAGGQIGWANLDGSNSASETVAEMEGYCGTEVGDTLGTPGVQTVVTHPWNARFGLYQGSGSPSVMRPDFSGYGYTATNWPAQFNAYEGPAPGGTGPPATAQNFVAKRAQFASCADTTTRIRGANSCESITGLSLNSFSSMASPGPSATDGHRRWGTSRRLVIVPVVDAGSHVIDYACMFMLHPLSIPMAVDGKLEYRGNAGITGSPCTTAGLPGGSAGPLVPVLVR